MTILTQAESDFDLPAAEPEMSFPDALQYVLRLSQSGRFEGAIELSKRLLEAVPGHPDVLHLMGLAHHRMGQPDVAIDLLRQAIAAAPEFAGFHNNLGNIYMQQGRTSEATQAYERAIELAHEQPDLHNNLGALYMAERRFDEAQLAYQRAIDLQSDHLNAHNNLGLLYAERGDRPRAIHYYVRALELMPGNDNARRLLASTYYATGRIADAAEVYRQWLEKEPDHPMAQHMYAACTGQGVPARAQDNYVEQTFDRFAASFESILNERLHYQAPQLCADMLAHHLPPPQGQFVMLDAGCGTGLCGPLMAPWAKVLGGVDLSRGMLDQAQTKGVYTDLYKAELTDFLALSPGQWDVVLSADTLCYFGDLTEVIKATAGALRPAGTLIFTVESLPDDAGTLHQIQPHGRYAHRRQHVAEALGGAGLNLLENRAVVLREEGGKPVSGWLVVARLGA